MHHKKKHHLVLLHGFAANKTIWKPCIEKLSADYTLEAIDLPGYGEHEPIKAEQLQDLVQFVLSRTKTPVIWVGWSLGGLVARMLAHQAPQYTQGIITIASNPQFVISDDWSCGIKMGPFIVLEQLFMRDPKKALLRFFTLQGQGAKKDVRERLLILKKQAESVSNQVFLRDLQILAHTDLRQITRKFSCPQLNILGAQDRIVPQTLIQCLKYLSPQAQNVTIPEAGHVLLLSHVNECVTYMKQFINESIITE